MSKAKIIRIIAVILLVFGIILSIPNTEWSDSTSFWSFIILICGTLGSLISIFIPTDYTKIFNEADWEKNSEGYSLMINAKQHGLGKSPQSITFEKVKNSYKEVIVESNNDNKGNVMISANSTFKGKVVIK